MNDRTQTIEERISAKTDLAIAGGTQVSSKLGGLEFKDMGQVMEFSKLMAVSGQAVPKHLRATPGACLAVSLQAMNWHMDPFAVANKSYMVNDRIAYEAQLIHAVIEQRAPIKGRLKGKYEGEGAKRVCVLTAISQEDGDTIEYRSPEIGSITTKNSPLWKSDPDQQLWYYSARAMCRRHFPDVLLGVYEKEEIQHADGLRDVTPTEPTALQRRAMAARGQVMPEATEAEPVDVDQVEDAQEIDVPSHWTEAVEWGEGAPGSKAWDEGMTAYHAGADSTDCPYEDDLDAATDWIGAWHGARRAAE